MKFQFTSLSKTPRSSAYAMFESGLHYLSHAFDSSECRDWELTQAGPRMTLTTFYEGTIQEEDGLPELIRDDLAEFLQRRGFKFKQETL